MEAASGERAETRVSSIAESQPHHCGEIVLRASVLRRVGDSNTTVRYSGVLWLLSHADCCMVYGLHSSDEKHS